jgi:anti-sigma B factor antagonist
MTATKPHIETTRCRLTLTGEIDLANAEDYLAAARAMIAECKTTPCFTIDLSGVTFMGSTGLAMLVGIRKAATNAGMELRLDGTPARVSQLLQITGLADHFGVTAGPP